MAPPNRCGRCCGRCSTTSCSKHPDMGLKLLLPVELSRFIEREQQDFFQRSRLDKQNMVPSLDGTGEALFDLANALSVGLCQPGAEPSLVELFDPAVVICV